MVQSIGEWVPKTYEDRLLHEYWLKRRGIIYLEVSIGTRTGTGRFPEGSVARRIDAVRIPAGKLKPQVLAPGDYRLKDIQDAFRGKNVEVIEIKRRLNRPVFGQVIAGTEMFWRQYRPNSIKPVILYEVPDPVMKWVCRQYRVKAVAPLGEKSERVTSSKAEFTEPIDEALDQ
jgi:hypothetical protein